MIASALWPRTDGVPGIGYTLPGTGNAWAGNAPLPGTAVPHEATPLPRPSGRRMAASMTDLIYNQLHLYPLSVELGLLSGAESRSVLLWNATFSAVEMYGVSAASPAGTQLSGVFAGPLAPTGVAEGVLEVLASGPARQDTTYTFSTGLGERSLSVTASRVLLFPFMPDWSGGLDMDYAFDTVIARSENGGEQRRPLVKRPLRTLRASVWGDGVNGQLLHNLVQQGKDRVFGVPVWQEALDVAEIDATRLAIRTKRPFGDCWNLTRLCNLVMLHERRGGAFLACSVASQDTGTVTVTAPIPELFAGPTTRMVPLFAGILTSAEPSTVSDALETWTVEFRELAGSQPDLGALPHAPADPAPAWLWPHRPDWSGGAGGGPGGTSSLLRTLRTVRGGVMELGSWGRAAPVTHRQSYWLREAELAALLDGATFLRGRWRTALVRDPRRAFTLTRESTADKAVLYALDNGAREGFVPGQRLWITLPGGESLSRRLTAVEAGLAGELALHLDAELGVFVPPVARVGREYRARLDTDNIRVRHESAGVSRCDLTFRTLAEED